MGVHGDDGGEPFHPQMPHGFGYAELEQVDVENLFDGPRVELGGSADTVEIDSSVLLESGQSLWPHTAFADDGADAVAADYVGLVGLFTDGGGRAGGLHGPLGFA